MYKVLASYLCFCAYKQTDMCIRQTRGFRSTAIQLLLYFQPFLLPHCQKVENSDTSFDGKVAALMRIRLKQEQRGCAQKKAGC